MPSANPSTKGDQLKSILGLLSSSVTKTEFEQAAKVLIDYVKRIKSENEREWSLMKAAFSMLGDKLDKKTAPEKFDAAYQEHAAKVSSLIQDHKRSMKMVVDKANSLKSIKGDKGDPGVEGNPGVDGLDADEEAIVARILSRLPKPSDTTDSKMRPGWGAHTLVIRKAGTVIDKVARNINFKGSGVSSIVRNPDGTIDVTISATSGTAVYDEAVSGSGTTFTLAHTPTAGTVRVYGLGQRLIPTTDWTISGAIITTTASWSAGQIIADYVY